MTNNASHFFSQTPGPFHCFESSEGVDRIVGVACRTSESYIAAAHYWDDSHTASIIADAVAFALNLHSAGLATARKLSDWPDTTQWLLARYPGPFLGRPVEHPWDGQSFVECLTTGHTVIQEIRTDSEESLIVTRTIAEALNGIRRRRLLDTPRRLRAALRVDG